MMMKKLWNFIIKHKYFLIAYVVACLLIFVKLPYYIDAPGGLINVSDRIEIEDGYSSAGSFNLAYVSEYEATIPMLFLSLFFPDWDVYSKNSTTSKTETYDDLLLRDRLWMEQAYADAVILAYSKAGKEIEITSSQLFILYVYEDANTDLKVGDLLLTVDGKSIQTKEELSTAIASHEAGDILSIEVLHGGESFTRYAEVLEIEGVKIIGIVPSLLRTYSSNPSISIYYGDSESGPSGGLMIALAVYNSLVEEDITKGLTIVGTGTIDEEGVVGEIGGVEYKLKGAAKKKADIFFVPSGENYEEAMALKKEKNYDIEIVPVSTFEDALEYLEKNV